MGAFARRSRHRRRPARGTAEGRAGADRDPLRRTAGDAAADLRLRSPRDPVGARQRGRAAAAHDLHPLRGGRPADRSATGHGRPDAGRRRLADPIIGAGIGLFIVPRTWGLLRQAEHDLHAWTLTSGLDAMSCHVVVEDMARARDTLASTKRRMTEEFGLPHTTVQVEDRALRDAETHRPI